MSAIKFISSEAKKIRKKHPKLEWKECIKKASAIYSSKNKFKDDSKKISGMKNKTNKKSKPVKKISSHKDSKSHNVKISVMSGLKKYNLTSSDFKRIDNDTNGNPRYVLHWLSLADSYDEALYIAKKIGGRKYHNKKYGGGIAFQSYNIDGTAKQLNELTGAIGGLDKVTKKGKKTYVQYSRLSGMPNYSDPDMARELDLYATNDSQLYYQQRKPILINLGKKYKKGTYEIDKAAKLWRYFVDTSLKKYNKEFGSSRDKWSDLMSVHDRNLLAHQWAIETKQEFDLGNFTEK